jgi:hypothetical protein
MMGESQEDRNAQYEAERQTYLMEQMLLAYQSEPWGFNPLLINTIPTSLTSTPPHSR